MFNNEFKQFFIFLKSNQIIATIISTILSTYITEYSNSVISNLIMPIIYRDANNDSEPDINKYKNYIINIKGAKFKIGQFYIDSIKFILICVIIFFITKTFN